MSFIKTCLTEFVDPFDKIQDGEEMNIGTRKRNPYGKNISGNNRDETTSDLPIGSNTDKVFPDQSL